jgi:hypothetical protein
MGRCAAETVWRRVRTYPELYGSSRFGLTNLLTYTLTLSSIGVPGTNYSGLRISALDPFHDLRIYDGTTLVAEFNSADFAYVNVCDPTGYITSVRFSDSRDTGFESSNDAVACVNPIQQTGTIVTPEPAAIAVFSVGLLGLAVACRRQVGLTQT